MTLRGTGHGLSIEDKVRAIVVDYVRRKYVVKDDLKLEKLQFDDLCYSISGHYKDDKQVLHQFIVKVDRDGNVVE